jgi:di/tripeptidase
MGRAIAKIAEVRTPASPKTTFTVGTVSGGTSVNTIAPDAKMAIDIRSDQMEPLLETEKKILAAIDESVAEENRRWNVSTLSAATRLIGDRRGGRTPVDSVIVEAAVRANTHFGSKTLLSGASTDANVPMSLGIPSIVIGGGGKTGGFHALSEWIDVNRCVEGRAELTRHGARPCRRAGRDAALAREAPGTHPIGLRDRVPGCERLLVLLLTSDDQA